MSFEVELDRIINEVVAVEAVAVDRDAVFPQRSVDALTEAGILAITVPAEFGGDGQGLEAATTVVRRISNACGSTAMVVAMHYAATALLLTTDHQESLIQIGQRRHLTTLAFSEFGSRSHFWAPMSTARAEGDDIVLDAKKSWVTSAHHATCYVWSSQPIEASGPMTLWFVRTGAAGLSIPSRFDGMGLRGNDSCPVTAEGVRVTRGDLLGVDGAGLDLALSVVLPWFLTLNASASVGLMQSVTAATTTHLSGTQLQHLGQSLAQQLPARTRLARMQIETDKTRTLIDDALAAVNEGRPEAPLLVLETKAAADEAAANVADLAMTACGGAAFRKELTIERRFRDSRAARVMAPTTDALLDFVGRALCGLPLMDQPA